MVCHWLASQKGIIIKWQQVLRACLNSFFFKKILKCYKLKSESKCEEKRIPKIGFFSEKGKIVTEYSLVMFIFLHFGKICTKNKTLIWTKSANNQGAGPRAKNPFWIVVVFLLNIKFLLCVLTFFCQTQKCQIY